MFSFMMTSADGYHADPGQALDWHNVDQEFISQEPAGPASSC